jgi:hypothetical protein
MLTYYSTLLPMPTVVPLARVVTAASTVADAASLPVATAVLNPLMEGGSGGGHAHARRPNDFNNIRTLTFILILILLIYVVFFLRVFSAALIACLGVFYYLLLHSDALTEDIRAICAQCEQFLSTNIYNLGQLLSPISNSAAGAASPLYHSNRIQIFLALLYIVSPLDLIPDVIPIIGWVDDGFLFLFACFLILHEFK